MKLIKHALAATLLTVLCSHGQSPSDLRTWTDQEGRTIKAAWVKTENEQVVLRLENGSTVQVPITRFSAPDQAFARQVAAPSPHQQAAPSEPTALVWPETVAVATKDLQITVGEQDASQRRYVYQSGSFQFMAQAPLTGTVMRDIASDFELVKTLFTKLPWGWEPKPRNGQPFYLAKLHETEEDYIKGGGSDNSSGGSTNEYIFTKFSSLGLKKVGGKYAFDAKLRTEGSLISLITRLLVADMRGLTLPWSALGIEELIEHVAYRNGAFVFTNSSRALRARLEDRAKRGYNPDLDRMLTRLKAPWSSYRDDSVQLRLEAYLDSLLLIYFFGFLDDDGNGARLHHYFHSLARDTLEYRRYMESGRTQRMSWSGSFADRAAELNKIVIGNRSDEQLREAMQTKFRAIGIKL